MPAIDGIADFLFLHMKDKLQDKEFMRLVTSYRNSASMYNHLNEIINHELLVAIKEHKPIEKVWIEAARIAIWVARIADLYEKEADKLEAQP